jgi:hypothetical protein
MWRLLQLSALWCFSGLGGALALVLRGQRSDVANSTSTRAFRSSQCQVAIAKERDRFMEKWVPDMQNYTSMQTKPKLIDDGIFISRRFNFAYIPNQKVASQSFRTAFDDLANYDQWLEHLTIPYSASTEHDDISKDLDGMILFTFVRAPLDVAYSAYREVSHRASAYKGLQRTLVNVSCDEGDARFYTFLKALSDASLDYHEVYHSWPQVVKTDILSNLGRTTFDFIGRIENVDQDLKKLFQKVRDNLQVVPDDFDEMVVSFKEAFISTDGDHMRGTQCDDQIDESGSENGLADPRVCPLACEIYSSDFDCFGYERPACCQIISRPL